MYALDAATGRAIWPAPFTARDGEMLLVTPVLDGDTLVVLPNLAGANPNRLYVLNKNTGAQLWQYPPVTQ
jgi:outer membrane protein assembly factor BamB